MANEEAQQAKARKKEARFATDRDVAVIKPPAEGRMRCWDTKVPGFGLRVSPSGRKSWFVAFRSNGRWERLTLGTYPSTSLATARQKAKDALSDVAHGQNPAEIKRLGRKAETFKEVAERYLEEYARPNKRSWQRDKEILDRDVLPRIGRLKANKVTRTDVRQLLRVIVNRKAPVMANRTLEVVRGVFNWALREEIGDLEANPCAQMKRPGGEERARERALTDAEVATFWTQLEVTDFTHSMKVALRFMLVTAQRKGEVIAATWSEIDLDAGVWTLPAQRSKNGLSHRVPLSSLSLDLLRQAKALAGAAEHVFPSPLPNRSIAPASVNNALYRNRDVFGVPPFTAHDLRRTAATQMASMGIPRAIISKVLNHVEAGITTIYDRYGYDTEKRRALDAWADRLSDIVGMVEQSGNVASLDTRRLKRA